MKVANVPATLLTREQATALKLKNEQYLVIIPKTLLNKLGVTKLDFVFELIYDKDKVSLVVNREQSRETQQPAKVSA